MLAALVVAAPFAVQARPFDHWYGPNRGMWQQNIPQERQEAFFQALERHQEKMFAIQEQIWTKETTMDALSRNPNTNAKDITALANEISALRNQAFAERKAFSNAVRKDFSIDMPYGPGMGGYGMGGYGHRGGYGMGGYGHRGGFHGGPNGCRGGW